MKTNIVKINKLSAMDENIVKAAKIIRSGGLVAFPTETVYGLGANGLDAKAAAGIYAAKGRPSDNPLILHVCDFAMLADLVVEIPETAKKIITAFCPGPITMILKHKKVVPAAITGGLDTVGIRMPDDDIARALIRLSGVPIAAPSANTSGRPSPTTAAAVLADLDGKIDMLIDGGASTFGVESTIVDCTSLVPTVLRPGAITMEMLTEVLGDVALDPALVGADTVPKAPGMKYRHYAPKAPLIVIKGVGKTLVDRFLSEIHEAVLQKKNIGLIVSAELAKKLPTDCETFIYGSQTELSSIAASLYEGLRSFDDKKVDILFAEGTTEVGIGLAIMNRLNKASGFHTITA